MKINALHIISYGKLKNLRIDITEGINCIYGENEAGKSTILAFIKAMLFGFGQSRGAESDRKRYAPWDGTVMAGEMEITIPSGRRLIIQRKSGRTPAQDICNVLDAVTGEPDSFELAEEIGIGENGFLRTFYVRQMGASFSGGDDDLTDKLINLALHGEEEIGYYKAIDILDEKMRFYMHKRGNGGEINTIKQKIMTLQSQIAEAELKNQELLQSMHRQKVLQEEITSLREKLATQDDGIAALEAQHALDTIHEAERQLSVREREAETVCASLQEIDASLQESDALQGEIDDIVYRVLPDKAGLQSTLRSDSISMWFFVILTIAFLGAGAFVSAYRWPLVAAAAIMAGLMLRSIISRSRHAAAIADAEEAEKQRDAALARFGCHSLQEYTERKAHRRALMEKRETILAQQAQIAAYVQKARETLDARIEDTIKTYGSLEMIAAQNPEKAMEETRRLQALLNSKMSEAGAIEGRLAASFSPEKQPDVLAAKLYAYQEELQAAEEEYQAISLASKTLREAFTALSQNFLPKLNALASSYFSVLTGKKENLLLDKQYQVSLDRTGIRPLQQFSGGTIDQAFLAVRLAMIQLAFPDNNMPLFLDDIFQQYDLARTQNAASLLTQFARDRQVILFSCRHMTMAGANIIEL
ncbi:MAG: AAA family ATPase [Clostridia bacterium]|nr:AAA family ATPase [Clostridia bacterium]